MGNQTELLVCCHCGNRVPLQKVGFHLGQELFEHIDGRRFSEKFEYLLYQCPTCSGISVYGDFVDFGTETSIERRRLYPIGNKLVPEPHKVDSEKCIPEQIVRIYEEIWPLRHIAPNAFAGQVRRALESICHEQNAQGQTLFEQLKDLVSRGAFPGHFSEVTDLMRKIGNQGAHAGQKDVDYWDADLLDDFFRAIVEYVYVVPSKIARMKRRIAHAIAVVPQQRNGPKLP